MDVLMIGHSRSGKTSYMAGLYRNYGNVQSGFGIIASVKDEERQLKALGENLSRGIYPSQTDIAEEYDLWLTHDGRKIIPFNWYDYRGGALLESSKTSKATQDLIERIEKADALIIFLDGDSIIEDDAQQEESYDTLIWTISKAISKLQNDTVLPISFVITKGDLYESYKDCLYTPGFNYFSGLLSTISKSKNIKGMVTVCQVTSTKTTNVFQPLLFSLYYGMDGYIEHEMARLSEKGRELDKEEQKLLPLWYEGTWGDIDDFVTGVQNYLRVEWFGQSKVESDRQKAADIKIMIAIKKREIHDIKENLEYLNGKKKDMINDINRMIKDKTMIYLNK